MEDQRDELQAKLQEATEIVKRLDKKFASFVGAGCDDDILNGFHLDVFTFGLFALDEASPLGTGVRENELQLLDGIVGERYGMGVYDQIVDILGAAKWASYQEEIPFTFSALIACSPRNEVVQNCADYIELFMILAFCLCAGLGLNPMRVMGKVQMLSRYRDYEFNQRGIEA